MPCGGAPCVVMAAPGRQRELQVRRKGEEVELRGIRALRHLVLTNGQAGRFKPSAAFLLAARGDARDADPRRRGARAVHACFDHELSPPLEIHPARPSRGATSCGPMMWTGAVRAYPKLARPPAYRARSPAMRQPLRAGGAVLLPCRDSGMNSPDYSCWSRCCWPSLVTLRRCTIACTDAFVVSEALLGAAHEGAESPRVASSRRYYSNSTRASRLRRSASASAWHARRSTAGKHGLPPTSICNSGSQIRTGVSAEKSANSPPRRPYCS